MRVVIGCALCVRAGSILSTRPSFLAVTLGVSSILFSILLILGLWTPIVGALIGLFQTWQAFTFTGDPIAPVLLGSVGIGLAMLGPGLWSIDARLFGWKRLESPARRIGL